ncbi:MAG: GNAT family N-acetyltransferase [Lysobacterales bacterium]
MPAVTLIQQPDRLQMAAFEGYVRQVFPRASFAAWMAWGEWNEDYRALALMAGAEIIANVSLTRMQLLLDGNMVPAWQLGAVGVLPQWRGQGLSRQLMEAALSLTANDPVLLFANDKVRDFYPRFGFAPCPTATFVAEYACDPGQHPAPALPTEAATTRALIHDLAESGLASTRRFGARGYGRTLTWYLANRWVPDPRQLDSHTLVFCRTDGDCLVIDDILSAKPFDLDAALPRLISSPIRRIRFGFTPELCWPRACTIGTDDDAHLFVRGFMPETPQRFPVLART